MERIIKSLENNDDNFFKTPDSDPINERSHSEYLRHEDSPETTPNRKPSRLFTKSQTVSQDFSQIKRQKSNS